MITIRSGILKNKRLQTPDKNVRPTSDKIRQAIFNVIAHGADMPTLDDAKVLDAFAGTGAMGLEAISRGAAHGWFMEKDSAVQKILRGNLRISDAATLLTTDTLAPPPAPSAMDFVFLDPPYGRDLIAPAITALQKAGWISTQTMIVIECDADENIAPPDDFKITDERKYGSTKILFVRLGG